MSNLKKTYSGIVFIIVTIRKRHNLILIGTLFTIILVQNYGHHIVIPVLASEKVELPAKTVTVSPCNIDCLMSEWVEIRTQEIMLENEEQYRTESRYKALIEINQITTQI